MRCAREAVANNSVREQLRVDSTPSSGLVLVVDCLVLALRRNGQGSDYAAGPISYVARSYSDPPPTPTRCRRRRSEGQDVVIFQCPRSRGRTSRCPPPRGFQEPDQPGDRVIVVHPCRALLQTRGHHSIDKFMDVFCKGSAGVVKFGQCATTR